MLSEHFQASAETILKNQHLIPLINQTADVIFDCFKQGGKLLICGNGGSATDAQHLSSELLNRYLRERRELPGIALTTDTGTITAIGNDYDFDQIFSKQVNALANPGDLLMVITSSGNSANLLKAVESAHAKGARCIALNGKGGGKLTGTLTDNDINIVVKSDVTARVQEVHGLIIHCLCELIDHTILDT